MAATYGLIKAYKASAAVGAHRIVAMTSAGTVRQATGPDDTIVGVSDLGAGEGATCDVMHTDLAEIVFGGPVDAGAAVTADADGKAIAAAPAAGANARVVGHAAGSAVAGDIAPVLLSIHTMQGA